MEYLDAQDEKAQHATDYSQRCTLEAEHQNVQLTASTVLVTSSPTTRVPPDGRTWQGHHNEAIGNLVPQNASDEEAQTLTT